MTGQTVGWGLAHLVPFLSWYAIVHLPTEWYKQGLRVGAKERKASHRLTSLTALGLATTLPILLLFGAAFAVGVADGLTGPSKDEAVRDLQWEVYFPNTGDAVGEPGTPWEVGIRSRGNKDGRFELVTRVTGPEGVKRESRQTINGPDWAKSMYPEDFPGGNSDEVGTYAIVFEVEGIQVGRDSFRIVESAPPNTDLEFFMETPFRTSTGSTVFNASVDNLSNWYATNIVIHLELSDANGNIVERIDQPIGDLGPGESDRYGVANVPADVEWELYGSEITWDWEPP